MKEELLLEVQDSFPLTGLGVLLLPAGTVPALEQLALHTVWPVVLVEPAAGGRAPAVASVEEITRSTGPERALLLTQPGATPVPPGTRVLHLVE